MKRIDKKKQREFRSFEAFNRQLTLLGKKPLLQKKLTKHPPSIDISNKISLTFSISNIFFSFVLKFS